MSAPARPEHGQSAYRRRFEWGATGARALVADAQPGDVAVVVDVLSFTTTLSVALDHGITVYPYPWASDEATAYAEERGAVLARGRRAGLAAGSVSLSPASFVDASGIDRVVLPSPNGSAVTFGLRDAGVTVVGACLRNASAVGAWLRPRPGRVLVIAAGERWPDGSLRPAAEDLWGAGAVLHAVGIEDASPEARLAAAAYADLGDDPGPALAACSSGRELVDAGFSADVEIAGAVDTSDVVPVLGGEAFGDAAVSR